MANNTKQAVKDAKSLVQKRTDYYSSLFGLLYNNAVIVENCPADLPKRYLLNTLRTKGGIAYDKETKLFLPFVHRQIDNYGLPKAYSLIGYAGLLLERLPEEVVILRANDVQYAVQDYFDIQTEKLVNFDGAIDQNLEAIKTQTIAEVEDESTMLSLANETQSRRIGATIVYKNKNAMKGTRLLVQDTGAEYLIDKLQQDRQKIFDDTIAVIGINTANTDKKERVQNKEIDVQQGFALDCMRALIDTFNNDAEVGGLSIRLKGNTTLFKDKEKEESEVETDE